MIDADAGVEPAAVVEVNDLVDGVWGFVLADVVERPAVAEGDHVVGQSEKAADAEPVDALPLGFRVFPGPVDRAVDDRFRDQDPVVRHLSQHLVGVEVVALPHTKGMLLVVDKVIGRIDEVLAVRKVESHRGGPWVSMYARTK